MLMKEQNISVDPQDVQGNKAVGVLAYYSVRNLNAVNGVTKELPIIGKYRIIK